MIDPFSQAQSMQQQSQPPASASANPGLPMSSIAPANGQDQFSQMAQKMGLSTGSFSKNGQVAKLQLMNQLQQMYGPQFMQHPDAKQLLSAFDASQPEQSSVDQARESNAMNSQAKRTLAALMQVNGGSNGS